MDDQARERRLNIWIAAGVLAALALVAVTATLTWNAVSGDEALDCTGWQFTKGEWETDPDQAAFGLVRCKELIGLSSDEVTAMLGRPREVNDRLGRWIYSAGTVHEAVGPGDAQTLFIRFDGEQVAGASLAYSGNRAQ